MNQTQLLSIFTNCLSERIRCSQCAIKRVAITRVCRQRIYHWEFQRQRRDSSYIGSLNARDETIESAERSEVLICCVSGFAIDVASEIDSQKPKKIGCQSPRSTKEAFCHTSIVQRRIYAIVENYKYRSNTIFTRTGSVLYHSWKEYLWQILIFCALPYIYIIIVKKYKIYI